MKYGTAPSELSFLRRMFFPRVERPSYLGWRDDLRRVLKFQPGIIKRGVVRAAAIIQANSMMFDRGNIDLPGELLISLDENTAPGTLRAVADGLFSQKRDDWKQKDLGPIAKYLSHERTRVYGLEVPRGKSQGIECFCTTTIFRRKSLPDGRLTGRLLPVLVDPLTKAVIVLPCEYWSPLGHGLYG